MIQNILLHIGVHKTASTTIQNTLYNEREKLAGKGILYPAFKAGSIAISNHSIPFYSLFCKKPEIFHFNVSHGYVTPETINRLHDEYRQQLETQIKGFSGDTLIISAEDISLLEKSDLNQLRDYLIAITQPQVIISVVMMCRHPVSKFRSALQGSVCAFGLTIEKATQNHLGRTHLYRNLVTCIAEVFGGQSIILIKYEDAVSHPFGPAGALLAAKHHDLPNKIKPALLHDNPTRNYETFVLLNAINQTCYHNSDYELQPQRMVVLNQFFREMPGQKFMLPEGLSKKVWEILSEDANWLCREFSLPEYQFLDKDLKPEADIWSKQTLEYLRNMLPDLSPAYYQIILWELFNTSNEKQLRKLISYLIIEPSIISKKHNAHFTKSNEELKILNKLLTQKIKSLQIEIDLLHNQNTALSYKFAAIKSSHAFKTGKLLALIHPFQLTQRLKEKMNVPKNLRLIKESGLFDEDFYLENNIDVKGSGLDAASHYLIYGGFEGRNPSEKFDSAFYLLQNPDVKSSGINPLIHFIEYGENEGRPPVEHTSALIVKNPAIDEEYDEHALNLPVKIVVKNPKKLQSFVLENDGKIEFINLYFDRIYVINLRRRQSKLIEIVQKLKRLNISAEIVEAVDGYKLPHIDEYKMYKTIPLFLENAHPEESKLKRKLIYSPGVWGHLKSNRLILKDALAKGYQRILILEDDAMFMKNFHQEFEKFTAATAGINWKFLYLGATQACWDIPDCIVYPDKSLKTYQPGQPFYHPVTTVGSFALAIHRSQFKNIIDKIDEMNCPFDWIYKLAFNHLSDQCFVVQPNLIITDMAESDNRPKEDTLREILLAIQRRKWDLSKYD